MAIEEPPFEIIAKKPTYEVRKYSEMLVAETRVQDKFDRASSTAFRVLLNYISGANKSNAQIDANTSATSQQKAEKIEMTAPVSQVPSDRAGEYLVRFTMPKKYTLETLPVPTDERVTIKKLPATTYAVHRYSGTWSASHYDNQFSLFKEALDKDGIKAAGEATWSRYDPPWTLWFWRRNEIWLPIVQEQ